MVNSNHFKIYELHALTLATHSYALLLHNKNQPHFQAPPSFPSLLVHTSRLLCCLQMSDVSSHWMVSAKVSWHKSWVRPGNEANKNSWPESTSRLLCCLQVSDVSSYLMVSAKVSWHNVTCGSISCSPYPIFIFHQGKGRALEQAKNCQGWAFITWTLYRKLSHECSLVSRCSDCSI